MTNVLEGRRRSKYVKWILIDSLKDVEELIHEVNVFGICKKMRLSEYGGTHEPSDGFSRKTLQTFGEPYNV